MVLFLGMTQLVTHYVLTLRWLLTLMSPLLIIFTCMLAAAAAKEASSNYHHVTLC